MAYEWGWRWSDDETRWVLGSGRISWKRTGLSVR